MGHPQENMDIYADSIQNLPTAERLRLVEQIWDGLSSNAQPLPLPEWAISESKRRRDELLADPALGLSHDEMWRKIDETRNG
jgi:putative addiction module component (TIGR02574 family)